MTSTADQELLNKINSLDMAILVVDQELNISLINDAFNRIWSDGVYKLNVGDPFRKLLDTNRPTGLDEVTDETWEDYIALRLSEIEAGNIEPYELEREDGVSLLYSVSNLEENRRLISYFEMSSQEIDTALASGESDGMEGYRIKLQGAIRQVENYINACNQSISQHVKSREMSDEKDMDPAADSRLRILPRKQTGAPAGTNLQDNTVQHAIKDAKRKTAPGEITHVAEETQAKQPEPIAPPEQSESPEPVVISDKPAAGATAPDPNAVLEVAASVIPQALLIISNGTVQYHNPQFLELSGMSADTSFVGKPASDALYQNIQCLQVEDKEGTLSRVLASIEKRETYTIEHLTTDGRAIRIHGVSDASGLFLFTYSDITDMRAQQMELQQAKSKLETALAQNNRNMERFKAFAEANSDWFWQMDSNLRFSYFSDTFKEVTGVDPERLLGKTRQETGVPGVEAEVLDAHLADLAAHRPFRDFTHSRQKADGSTVWLAISAVPIFDAHDRFEGYVGAGRDVTQQVAKQRELEDAINAAEAAERAKSEFLANMSHEIRTPMNGVMGMAELLAATELDTKQSMFTDVIVKSGASLLTIINDILDFSKLDAGQLELDKAPFNMAEAIEDVATLVSAKVAEKDLELIVRINPALPNMMIGDVGRLRQVMTNLLGNAVKFTEKGHVYVNVDGALDSNGDAKLRFAVEDTGIGIPDEECQKIFNKFNQVDTSATRKHEGTGLGLSIANSLISLMGGTIQVESKLGQGSTFWFEITLPADETAKEKAHVIPGDLQGARVLVIDDNHVNRSILSEQMAAWKFDSAAAASGAEGLRLVDTILNSSLSLDLIVLDYQMPEMSGGDVLRTLRNNPRTADIPVLMLTSVDSSQSNRELIELGVQGNLTKPARSSLLLETVLQIIATRRENSAHSTQETIQPEDQIPEVMEDQASTPVLQAQAKGLDILVAEDNEVNQIVFSQILEETGLSFKIADNGRLAFAAYKAHHPKLVLMDVSMPEMNGKESTIAIREYEKKSGMKRVPIVGVTAHALKGDMEACLDAGMDDYLSKPVSPSKLVRKVEQWLKVDLSFYEAG